jgi:hypothetical protein
MSKSKSGFTSCASISNSISNDASFGRDWTGGCHDWADAEWIVIRGPLRGLSDTPFGWPTPGRPVGRPGVGHPQGVFDVFSYYQLVTLFLNMVCLTVALTDRKGFSLYD